MLGEVPGNGVIPPALISVIERWCRLVLDFKLRIPLYMTFCFLRACVSAGSGRGPQLPVHPQPKTGPLSGQVVFLDKGTALGGTHME